ncbi:hypothetical protein BH09BAC4_BH09BAC4_27000 [soil metagenome]
MKAFYLSTPFFYKPMQRLSTIILSVALTVFVMAASLALLAAAWLMAAQFLGGQSRW